MIGHERMRENQENEVRMVSLDIIPFKAEHLDCLLLQPSQKVLQPTLADPEYGAMLEKGGPAYSGRCGDEIVACMGLVPQWENRALAWGLISREAGRFMVPITRAIFRTMALHHHRRIETAVACNFEEGHRWARMLGFVREGRMRAYTPGGDDCDLYARIGR